MFFFFFDTTWYYYIGVFPNFLCFMRCQVMY